MCRVDDFLRGWAAAEGVDLAKLQVAARWASSGHVVLKLIPVPVLDPRQMETHRRYDG
jgi:hypothetical protein